ncbi:MAG TPA: AsmA family protein [Verrucomicrobiae bacterium]|nr:AsmA family protein [Verrucomicrobiae bacterium]
MKKIISTVVLALLAVVIIALIVFGVCLNRIIKSGVETYGPKLTQTTVSLDSVNLSLLTGSARIKGLAVGNPQGFKTPQSISVGLIAVGLNPMSVFSQKVVIHTVRVESPGITFEGGLQGNNLSQILDNVNSSSQGSGTLSTNAATAPKSERKFEVDDLVVTGATVQVIITGTSMTKPQTITLPPIHLTDMGTGADGITAADLTRRVLSAISSATMQEVVKTAANLDTNAANLKEVKQHAVKQLGNMMSNYLNK